ncbi:acetyl-CoA carboxylase biotin carboxyl carrier protein [Pseudomonas oryzihabitans]|uniref:acetyl-CoA carboxylase biotin carboxyl carrier protein n=1 Tax=Pseudomonas oryzihabitans TaxID=47885 RepID=UPI002855EBEA|nr:biotin/lipoyl-containing protein [Pseudomonas psychrotolerans]MDR6678410.1 acetyl-CoA carboxylase biotin carboxyl carrier protein [Pseudomonas psychrotolerans]
MNFSEIREICQCFAKSQLSEIEYRDSHSSLRLLQDAAAKPVASSPVSVTPVMALPTVSTAMLIKSPQVGHFLVAHPSKATACARAGSLVRKGDIVAFLQVGPLLFPVRSDVDGTIDSILVEPQTLVEYATPLFSLSPVRSL